MKSLIKKLVVALVAIFPFAVNATIVCELCNDGYFCEQTEFGTWYNWKKGILATNNGFFIGPVDEPAASYICNWGLWSVHPIVSEWWRAPLLKIDGQGKILNCNII